MRAINIRVSGKIIPHQLDHCRVHTLGAEAAAERDDIPSASIGKPELCPRFALRYHAEITAQRTADVHGLFRRAKRLAGDLEIHEYPVNIGHELAHRKPRHGIRLVNGRRYTEP